MIPDVIFHTILGMFAAGTGYMVRGFCKHKGLLPHPRAHVALTTALVTAESFVVVSLFG